MDSDNWYSRINFRARIDQKVKDWLTLGANALISDYSRKDPNSGAFYQAFVNPPVYPVYNDANTDAYPVNFDSPQRYGFGGSYGNPYAANYYSDSTTDGLDLVFSTYAELKFFQDRLKLRSAYNLDFEAYKSAGYTPEYLVYGTQGSGTSVQSKAFGIRRKQIIDNTLTWADRKGPHSYSVMLGQSTRIETMQGLSGSATSVPDIDQQSHYIGLGSTNGISVTDLNPSPYTFHGLSFFTRGTYNYKDTYLATVTMRADASSKYQQKWGFFPSVAVAWRLSEEPFMRDLELDWLDNIKFRAGYGQVGNDGVSSNAFQLTMGSGDKVFYGYPLGNVQDAASFGAAVLTQIDRDGKWETNEQWDAGVDFSFWNGKLSGAIDYFRRNTLDALLPVNAPAHVGNRYTMVRNVGNIRNEGVEITLGHENKVGPVHYNISGNISYIHNELTKLNGGSPLWDDRVKTDLGMPLNAFWGYEYEGVYLSEEEVAANVPNMEGVHAGDARYKDQNGDSIINDDDAVYLGTSFPKVTYGINLGADFYGVDIQLFFQGVAGNQIYNALRERLESDGSSNALASYMKDQVWIGYTEGVQQAMLNKGINYMELENRDGTIPNPLGHSDNMANSTRFLENGSYLRLKNLQIGYTFPLKWTQKFHCSRLRVYATASNLFTITKYSGYDPEVGSGVDYGNYPQSRTFTFGLNANF